MEPSNNTPEPANEGSITPNPDSAPDTQPAASPPNSPTPQLVSSWPSASASAVTPPASDPVSTPQASAYPAPQSPAPAVFAQPVTGGQPPIASNPAVMSGSGPSRKKRWLLPAAVAVVLLLVLGGGYVFAFYLPNQPGAVYSKGLTNSGKAVDALVSYGTTVATKSYKSYGFSGTLHTKSTGLSADATLSGSFDEDANANIKLNADILSQKVDVNILSKHVQGNTSPDVYLQVSGIKSALDTYGLNSLDNLDGKWIVVDHTLVDSYASLLDSGLSQTDSTSNSVPTTAQIEDAVQKVQTVNKQYLFTTDKSTAVLQNQKYVGKETKDGRSTNHYKVGYDSAHLQAYVAAVGTALNSSKLNTWAKASGDGKNLSDMLDTAGTIKDIKNAKSGYTFDVWIDTKTKLVHSMQFTDPSDKTSVITLTQNYTGGDDYPFALSFSGKDSDTGSTETAGVKLAINTKTDKATGQLNVADGSDTTLSVDFTVTPSNDAVQVTAPTGATPVLTLLNQLGLSGEF